MDLSIIIVNWNTQAMLRDCLASVVGGIATLHVEIIVVDNASQDGSPEMVQREFPHVHLIRNTTNLGFAAANNQALALASGRNILLLNSDTIVLGDVLTQSVAYLDEHSTVGVMGCRVLNTDGSLQPTCSRFPTLINLMLFATGLDRLGPRGLFDRYLLRTWDRRNEADVDVVTGCYLMIRRSAMALVGLLDESFFFYGEETDWCRRFQNEGWAVRFAPVGQIVHHGSGSSRRLNHQRDLLLSSGLVRLHRKYGGVPCAAVAWIILLLFNLSRFCFWGMRSVADRTGRALDRRKHFAEVVRHFNTAWPRVAGGAL